MNGYDININGFVVDREQAKKIVIREEKIFHERKRRFERESYISSIYIYIE